MREVCGSFSSVHLTINWSMVLMKQKKYEGVLMSKKSYKNDVLARKERAEEKEQSQKQAKRPTGLWVQAMGQAVISQK